MNTLAYLVAAAIEFAAANGNANPDIIYVPVGQIYSTNTACTAASVEDGTVMYCADGKLIIMATNTKRL